MRESPVLSDPFLYVLQKVNIKLHSRPDYTSSTRDDFFARTMTTVIFVLVLDDTSDIKKR